MAKSTTKSVNVVAWRCHTPNLLKEVLANPSASILSKPLAILGRMLAEVADRAIELDDPKLHALMIRLTLYSLADPDSPDYDADTVHKYLNMPS